MQGFHATGRLCNNPRSSESSNGTMKVTFRLAVPRQYKKDGFPEADFFYCVAYGERAKFISKNLKKGMKVETKGEIQTYSFSENDKTYSGFWYFIAFIAFGESKAMNERYQEHDSNGSDVAEEIEREPYLDEEFMGIDGMQECSNCHAIVPPADICMECGARL